MCFRTKRATREVNLEVVFGTRESGHQFHVQTRSRISTFRVDGGLDHNVLNQWGEFGAGLSAWLTGAWRTHFSFEGARHDPFMWIIAGGKEALLPFLHDQHHAEEDDDEEQDASDDAGDLHRVIRLLLGLHRVGLPGGGTWNRKRRQSLLKWTTVIGWKYITWRTDVLDETAGSERQISGRWMKCSKCEEDERASLAPAGHTASIAAWRRVSCCRGDGGRSGARVRGEETASTEAHLISRTEP